MAFSKYFKLHEFTDSDYALRQGLDNTPPADIIGNLRQLADTMDIVRRLLGHPVLISSGFRAPKINAGVGGSKSSYHMLGLACDFKCPGFGTPAEVCNKLTIHAEQISYDKIILEFGAWTHLQIPKNDASPRMLAFTIKSAAVGYLPGILA